VTLNTTNIAIAGVVISILGAFGFTIGRALTMNNGQSTQRDIDTSVKINLGVFGAIFAICMVIFTLFVVKGEASPTMKYSIVMVLSILAFALSNLALLASSINVQVN
jgi:hypothetical protein